MLAVSPGQRELQGVLFFNQALFNKDTIDRMAAHLVVLLSSVAHQPQDKLSQLVFIDPQERQLVGLLPRKEARRELIVSLRGTSFLNLVHASTIAMDVLKFPLQLDPQFRFLSQWRTACRSACSVATLGGRHCMLIAKGDAF